jgi:hypothetical protein
MRKYGGRAVQLPLDQLPPRPPTTDQIELPEYTMFAYLVKQLRNLLERAEHSRRDAYLASSVDLFDLERRMRSIETRG